MDAAFNGNRLLASMSAELRARLMARADIVPLRAGESVFGSGDPVPHALMPFTAA